VGNPTRHTAWPAPYRQGWDPFSELAALRTELARMLGGAAGRGLGSWFGDLDVDESEQGWTVTARLPGVAPDEVVIEVEERDLCIRAKTEQGEDRSEAGEGSAGSAPASRAAFDYRVTLPGDVDPDRIDATMDHGLLTIQLPRAARAQRRQIAVGRGAGTERTGGAEPGATRAERTEAGAPDAGTGPSTGSGG